jgi:tetratricopeptide (TPR) repeat protein
MTARSTTTGPLPVTSTTRAARATLTPPMPRTTTGTMPPTLARTTTSTLPPTFARTPTGTVPPTLARTATRPEIPSGMGAGAFAEMAEVRSSSQESLRFGLSSDEHKMIAAEAFRRGQACLRADKIADAVAELERASELEPKEPTYLAALAWARFCRANDKVEVANDTRRALARAINQSETPVLARYYLGMVERILGRPEKAVEHFQEVLEMDPRHSEAATELRFLTNRRDTLRNVRAK